MSSSNINISWGVSYKFEESDLEQVLGKYSIIKKDPKSEHEKSVWEVNGLTIIVSRITD